METESVTLPRARTNRLGVAPVSGAEDSRISTESGTPSQFASTVQALSTEGQGGGAKNRTATAVDVTMDPGMDAVA
jgi:hypothetical protein